MVQLSHPYMTTGKSVALTIQAFVSKIMSLHLNFLSQFVIPSLPRSKCLLISRLQSLLEVILEPKKIKSVMMSTFPSYICHEVTGPKAMKFIFWMLSFKPAFSPSSFTFFKRLFSSSLLSARRVPDLHIWCCWYFSWQSWFHLVCHPTQHFTWCTLYRS